jgi:DNA-binding transcriptional LysR family regulator
MELRHLRYFVAVADVLSFRRAAEHLHISQPPLSTQIKALEEELGVRLFERLGRGIELTPEGLVFLEHARAVLAAVDVAKQAALNAKAGLGGTLRIGTLLPMMSGQFAGGILAFRQKYPATQLFISELTSPEQLQRLQDDQLDVGLMRPPMDIQGLETRFVEERTLMLVVPKGHRFANRRRFKWEDFRNEPMVMFEPNLHFGFYDAFLHECAKVDAMPFVSHYANNADTLFWLVSAGFGVTLEADIGWQYPGIVFCKLPSSLPQVRTMLVWKKSNKSPTLSNFIKVFSTL